MDPNIRIRRHAHAAMATRFELVADHDDSAYVAAAAAACWAEVDRLEGLLSRYRPGSDIDRAGRLRSGARLRIDPDTARCLLLAAAVSQATGGAFDPAYGSPSAVGSPTWTCDPSSLELTALIDGLVLDLGAIGKGYALDVAGALLEADWEINRACLVAGGSSVLALDSPRDCAGWTIGVAGRSVALARRAIGASGTSELGLHIHHPGPGRVRATGSTVWVLADGAAIADALSTALFVRGPDGAAGIARCWPGTTTIVSAASGLLSHGAPVTWADAITDPGSTSLGRS